MLKNTKLARWANEIWPASKADVAPIARDVKSLTNHTHAIMAAGSNQQLALHNHEIELYQLEKEHKQLHILDHKRAAARETVKFYLDIALHLSMLAFVIIFIIWYIRNNS